MELSEIVSKLAEVLLTAGLAVVASWWLFIRQRRATMLDQHRDAVRQLYFALARVGDADTRLVNIESNEGAVPPSVARDSIEAKDALAPILVQYVRTWIGEDLAVPRRVQVMCAYAVKSVYSHDLGSGNPAALVDHILTHLTTYYPFLSDLNPTTEDHAAVQRLLDDDMGGRR